MRVKSACKSKTKSLQGITYIHTQDIIEGGAAELG